MRPLLAATGLIVACGSAALPPPPHPDPPLPRPGTRALPVVSPQITPQAVAPAPTAPPAAPPEASDSSLPPAAPEVERCASVPPLGPDGAVPPAPPHVPVGIDLPIEGDRPVYVLPGNPGDPRVIVYLHGMCGDATAADYFREAVRAHGTLLAVRGDTSCPNGRFKWRADSETIQRRVLAALDRVNAERGGELSLEGALLFGYSQGADRAEKLAARFPKQYRRIVLGGAPMKASPSKLAQATRVAFLGGELETTDTMRAGLSALQNAGITSRWFTLECAYHGYFGIHPEAQLGEVLDWVAAP